MGVGREFLVRVSSAEGASRLWPCGVGFANMEDWEEFCRGCPTLEHFRANLSPICHHRIPRLDRILLRHAADWEIISSLLLPFLLCHRGFRRGILLLLLLLLLLHFGR